MGEIGTTLREARLRRQLEIADIEAKTKIRAKYLRALENEEWDLLPAPAYVKSFLRTYAQEVGLDGRLLVEEYKLRHERPSDLELQPISPTRLRDPRPPRSIPRGWAVGVVMAGLVAALVALAAIGSRSDRAASPSHATRATRTDARQAARERRARRRAARRRKAAAARRAKVVRLQVVATGPVYVCLENAAGRRLVNGVVLQPGAAAPTFRSRSFRLTLGNDSARLRINGRTRVVPPVTSGIGYEITKKHGRRRLSPQSRPTCAT